MSDMLNFTPNEEQLRLAYWHHVYERGVNLDRRDIDAEFTRGIERIKAQVRSEALRKFAAEVRDDVTAAQLRLADARRVYEAWFTWTAANDTDEGVEMLLADISEALRGEVRDVS